MTLELPLVLLAMKYVKLVHLLPLVIHALLKTIELWSMDNVFVEVDSINLLILPISFHVLHVTLNVKSVLVLLSVPNVIQIKTEFWVMMKSAIKLVSVPLAILLWPVEIVNKLIVLLILSVKNATLQEVPLSVSNVWPQLTESLLFPNMSANVKKASMNLMENVFHVQVDVQNVQVLLCVKDAL